MSIQPGVPDTSPASSPQPPQLVSLSWALRRIALWLLILFAMVVVLGWLFYAGIDPDEAAAGPSPMEQARPTQ